MKRVWIAAIALTVLAASRAVAGRWLRLECAFGMHRSYERTSASTAPTILPGQCVIAALRDDKQAGYEPGEIMAVRKVGQALDHLFRIVARG